MRNGWAVLVASLSWSVVCQAADEPLKVGDEAFSFMLKALNTEALGKQSAQVRLDDFVGTEAKNPKKAVVLSFFASWCEPCKREMPYLNVLHDTYQDKGLQILSITIDKEAEKIDVAHDLARQNNLKFPVLSDRFGIVARRYDISKLPCVYIVDAAGKVAWVNVGYGEGASRQMLDEVRRVMGIANSEPVPEAISTYLTAHQGPAHNESVGAFGAEAEKRDGQGKTDDVAAAPGVEQNVAGPSKGKAKGKGKPQAQSKQRRKGNRAVAED